MAQATAEHIQYAIPAQTHPPMYLMHKYWARKPHNVVREYIEHYTKPGEIVFDPFCGSGVTIIEALKAGRKAIGVDLDPVSIFITRMTGTYVDLNELKKTFNEIETKVKERVLKLYETRCTKCKQVAQIHFIVFIKSKPTKIYFSCNNCGTKTYRKFSLGDKKIANKIEKMKVPYWYPDRELIWNTRVNVHKGVKVSDLFSKRNLIALSIIYDAIKKIENKSIREIMRFVFSAALPQASRLLVYTPGQGPGWKVRGYWMPENRYEMNVWRFFVNKYKKILRGKEEANNVVGRNWKENENVWLYNRSATDLSVLKEDQVDYIFTDPPYGDSVPYLELNYMWALWLGFDVNFEDEIIISDSPIRRNKNFEMYSKMMSLAFREMYRVLRPGRWMTVTFHNTDIQIYNSIIRAAIIAGFDLEKIVYQPAAKVSAKAKLAPYGSAEGDYYIRFFKPLTARTTVDEKEIDKIRYERIVVETVKKIIAERGEPTPYSIIINSYALIYEKLKENGYLFSAPERIEEILKSHIGEDFTLVDNKWWFSKPETVPFIDMVPLHERVEKAVVNVLNRKVKASFDEILQEIFITFPNALTPEVQSINNVLKEYAQKTKDKKWMLRLSVKHRESEHDHIVKLLANIGEKAKYQVYADVEGWREKGLPLKIPKENLERAKEIDVVWYNKGEALYEFEVENTTGITEAIVRGSNIPNGKIKRFIVIPEERENLLTRKVNEPALKERVVNDSWNFFRYDDLKNFYEYVKNKKEIDVEELEKLARMPKIRIDRQANFDEFV